MLLQLVLARGLGPAQYGPLAIALAAMGVIAPLATFGVPQVLLHLFGREENGAVRWLPTARKSVVVTLFLSILTYSGWASTQANAVGGFAPLVGVGLISFAALEFASALMRVSGSYRELAWILILGPVIRLLAVWCAFSYFGRTPIIAAAAMCGSYILHALLASGWLGRLYKRLKPTAGWAVTSPAPTVTNLLRQSWPFGVEILSYPLYFQTPLLVLGHFAHETGAGAFSVCATMLAGIYLVPDAVYQKYLLSKFHRLVEHDKPQFLSLYVKFGLGMITAGTLISIATACVAQELLTMLFGPRFQGATEVFQILIWCIPMRFASAAVGVVLFTQGLAKRRVASFAVGTVAAASVTILGLREWGLSAAGYGMLAGETAVLIAFTYLSWSPISAIARDVRASRGPLALGYYGMGNFGDDVFVKCVASASRRSWGREATICSFPVKGVDARYILNFQIKGGLSRSQLFAKLGRGLCFAYGVLSHRDVVLAGGSVIAGRHSLRDRLLYELARKGFIRLSAIGVSIGPFTSPEGRLRGERLVRMCNPLITRDRRSYLLGRMMNGLAVEGTDLAGLISFSDSGASSRDVNGVCCYIPCRIESAAGETLNTRLADAVAQYCLESGSEARVLSLNGNQVSGDDLLANEACEIIRRKGLACEVLRYSELGIERALAVIATSKIVVSVRLHGAIAAYMKRAPFLLVDYHEKCRDFVASVDDSRRCLLDADSTTPQIRMAIAQVAALPLPNNPAEYAQLTARHYLGIFQRSDGVSRHSVLQSSDYNLSSAAVGHRSEHAGG